MKPRCFVSRAIDFEEIIPRAKRFATVSVVLGAPMQHQAFIPVQASRASVPWLGWTPFILPRTVAWFDVTVNDTPRDASFSAHVASDARPEEPADALMERYAAGDDAAFTPLYLALAPRVRSFLMRLSRGQRRADDVLQETFMRMHRARGNFERGARVLPWAFTIARNAFFDQARLEGRRREDFREQDDRTGPADVSTPAMALEAEQTRALLEGAMHALPPNQREAFILVRFEGLSAADAAQVLDTTEANVRVRAHRAAETLRQVLNVRGSQ
jgi:RNA polymerase sigma-70 factor, ECF subfamily